METEPTIAASTFLSAFKILTESGVDAAELEKKAGLTIKNSALAEYPLLYISSLGYILIHNEKAEKSFS